MGYKEKFKHYTVEDKRKDLIGNPLFNKKKIANADDEIIIILHRNYFEAMNKAMEDTIGESMFDENETERFNNDLDNEW